MSTMTPPTEQRWSPASNDARWGGPAMARRPEPSGLPAGLTVAGLAVIGLGALALYYLGPDLVRYLKIRNM
jgi:hypothetical protein